MWNRSRRVTLATKITVDHICASAAIPLVFQPVSLETAKGAAFFGDGCLRLQQPLSPIIRLGAEKIFAIGVRCENREHQEEASDQKDPSLAQVMGVLFNVMFLDHLATDVEHLERLNQLLRDGHIKPVRPRRLREDAAADRAAGNSVGRTSPTSPAQHQKDMPYLIQYFVNSLGRDAASCSDLMSYLLFTPKYTRELIHLGYHDADDRIDEIEDYLFGGEGQARTNGNCSAANAASRAKCEPAAPAKYSRAAFMSARERTAKR